MPGGMNEYLGYWGLLTLANELLYVVIPVALVVSLVRQPERRRRVAIAGGAWFASLVLLRTGMPEDFTPTRPRVIEPIDTERAGRLADFPRADLPTGELVVRLDALKALGLFDVTLRPSPPRGRRISFPRGSGAKVAAGPMARRSSCGARCSDFGALRSSRPRHVQARTHGEGRHRAWSRRFSCDEPGALAHAQHEAAPALLERPLQRRRDRVARGARAVPRRRGHRQGRTKVRFHPNDIKALLAAAYDDPESKVIGQVCTTVAFDVGATCSMNPRCSWSRRSTASGSRRSRSDRRAPDDRQLQVSSFVLRISIFGLHRSLLKT